MSPGHRRLACDAMSDVSEPDTGATAAPDAEQERRRPSRTIVRLVLGFIIVRTIVANVATVFAPGLVPNPKTGDPGNPLLLMVLNTQKRWLISAKDEPFLVYFPVGLFSQLLSDPFWWLIGRWYGDAGIRWAERKFGDSITQLELMFKKAAYPMVAIAPNPYICLMAGAAGMAPPVFFALNIGGTIVALLFYRWVGDIFSGPLDAVFGFLRTNQKYFIALSLAIVGFQMWDQKRKGRSQVESISALEAELDEAAHEIAQVHDAVATEDHVDGERPAGGGKREA